MQHSHHFKHLTRFQIRALRKLTSHDVGSIDQIRKQMHVRPGIFDRWMQDENFRVELNRRLDNIRHISAIFLDAGLPETVLRLNDLLHTGKPETDRKVCADILKFTAQHTKPKQPEKPQKPAPPVAITDPVECERLWKLHRPIVDAQDNQNNEYAMESTRR